MIGDLGGRRVNVPANRISNNLDYRGCTHYRTDPDRSRAGRKTNREGFVDNDAYRAFQAAVLFAIEQAELELNIDKKRIPYSLCQEQAERTGAH